ncbi:hypothetical protein DPMN_172068 [Dreissena polymorpha]|uniref:Uncharacterized protein n=1 Tax=Dreissena polymorpha TaxID=45954 RepID=A0A9D4E2F1_DREPO|nr:hypothetical protein DPMN_172068 [Dreissena polymorpha]
MVIAIPFLDPTASNRHSIFSSTAGNRHAIFRSYSWLSAFDCQNMQLVTAILFSDLTAGNRHSIVRSYSR